MVCFQKMVGDVEKIFYGIQQVSQTERGSAKVGTFINFLGFKNNIFN